MNYWMERREIGGNFGVHNRLRSRPSYVKFSNNNQVSRYRYTTTPGRRGLRSSGCHGHLNHGSAGVTAEGQRTGELTESTAAE